jgi:tRNA U34 5-methylaminomethyl-2-thiouridine-forming methyltransferase MnmC
MHSGKDQAGFELVTVQTGVRSLRSREFGETFHPVVGPMIEAVALHVRQQRLVERAALTSSPFVIWDVGLGAAANAIAVLEAFQAAQPTARVELHSFDHTTAPLAFAFEHALELGYLAPHTEALQLLLECGRWQSPPPLDFAWHFHAGDFRRSMAAAPAPHAILYDPYSPSANPDLWTLEHFTELRTCLDPAVPCLLTNYTRSTAVRVTLLLAGFFVGRGHATGEKDQTTIASNVIDLLEDPLDTRWLDRVRRSTSSAPRRSEEPPAQISTEDFERLCAHPQFAPTGLAGSFS